MLYNFSGLYVHSFPYSTKTELPAFREYNSELTFSKLFRFVQYIHMYCVKFYDRPTALHICI